MICIVHIQPKKHVLDHADHATPTHQHYLHHTDHTGQEYVFPEACTWVDHVGGIDDLCGVWKV